MVQQPLLSWTAHAVEQRVKRVKPGTHLLSPDITLGVLRSPCSKTKVTGPEVPAGCRGVCLDILCKLQCCS